MTTKFVAVEDRKKMKENKAKLVSLDYAILEKCTPPGVNILRVIKAGKPYINKFGNKRFASTDEVMSAVDKLVKIGLLEAR